MIPPQGSLCLVMIVRNEASVIRRCLESVKAYIAFWIICDTGSTDNTTELVSKNLAAVPGELHQDKWLNFGHNRTLAIQRARGKAGYLLLMNADEILNVNAPIPQLSADAYLLRYEGDLDYHIPLLVRGDREWHYAGATHEHLASDAPFSTEKLLALSVTHFADGGMRKDKLQRDLDLLEKELAAKPENGRAVFYLAQSYRDLGSLARAMELYERRATMAGWEEETWYAAYQVACCADRLGLAWSFVLEAYLRAYSYRPTRLEPLYHIARHYRTTGELDLAWLFARRIVETPYPEDLLFIDRPIYEYLLPFEYVQCCGALRKQAEADRVAEQLLANPRLPNDIRTALTRSPTHLA